MSYAQWEQEENIGRKKGGGHAPGKEDRCKAP